MSTFDAALAALESEVALVFVDRARVDARCAELRRLGGDWSSAEHVEKLRRLVPLVHSRTGPFLQPLVALLRDVAVAAPSWPILAGLLASKDASLCSELLEAALGLAARGLVTIDEATLEPLADLAEQEPSPLHQPELLAKIASLIGHVPAAHAAAVDRAAGLYVGAAAPSVRRLAARVLDRHATLPSPETVAAVVGDAAAELLPFLTYTRASHLELAHLASRPGTAPEIAGSLRALDNICGRKLARDIVGELGWRRANLGIDTRTYVGVSVNDSLPFLLTPLEADLVGPTPGARRVFERIVAVGHGGSRANERGAAPGTGATGGADVVVSRFRAYNLEHAEALADILDVAPLTVDKVDRIIGRMDRITRDYVELFATKSEECAALPGLYGSLKDRIAAALRGAVPDRPLPVELTRLVQMFEDPPSLAKVQTLHGLKRYLHQKGLALGFSLLESRHGTNRSVDLVLASPERVLSTTRVIEYVDFDPAAPSPSSAPGEPPAIPYPVKVVVDGFVRQLLHGQDALPRVRVFCYGNEVHYFVSFRNHPVFVRLDFSPPLSGGMIDLVYYGVSKYELDEHPCLALDAIQACFRRLDFLVEVENTRIHARYDKERARDLTDLCDKAEALFRFVPYMMDLDWIIGALHLPDAARRATGDAWADLFARWGVIPVQDLLTEDRTGVLLARETLPEGVREVRWPGEGPYADITTGKPGPEFDTALHNALTAHGLDLPVVSAVRETGQLAIEAQFLHPLRAALARGELVAAPEGLRRADAARFERQHEADCLAQILASDPESISRSARLAGLATALERTLRFQTTSTINGYEVQRASLALRGQTASLYALRDGSGMFRLALFAPDGAIYRHRPTVDAAWQESVTSDVGHVAPLLRRNNFLPSWIDVAPRAATMEANELRASFRTPNTRAAPRIVPGERIVAGVKASPGRAVGLARLGTRGRHAEDLRGGVLFAATLSPSDSIFLYHAAAVVATGGGILSHAGLMAVQYGRPALIVSGEWEERSDGSCSLLFRRLEFEERRRIVAGFEVVERTNVHEYDARVRDGDLVVVDADDGLLRVLGQERAALTLHDELRQLDTATRRLARVTAPDDVLAERGRRLHAFHQLEKLARRLDDPALVQHALRELLRGPLAGQQGGARREQASLLRILRDRPGNAELVTSVVSGIARELWEAHALAHAEAVRLIASARSAHEVLTLRLAVRRLRVSVEEVTTFIRAAGMTAPPPLVRTDDEVERLAMQQLERLRDGLARRLRASAGTAADPAARHALAQAERVGQVIGVPEGDRRELERIRLNLQAGDDARVSALQARLVLWPGDGGLEIAPVAGSKAANLAEIARLGGALLVPPWFVITDRAFRDVLATRATRPGGGGARGASTLTLGQAIDATVARDDLNADEKSFAIRQLWAEAAFPAAVETAVAEAYRRLTASDAGGNDGSDRLQPVPAVARAHAHPSSAPDPFVAIRSSGREEDTEAATGAGEFETFLFVRGPASVLAHLRRAWAGLWTPRAIHDRATAGRAGRGEGGGVIVQRIAWSRVSGVLQTTNLAEGRTREMVVNVGLGLGEGIVSGLVAADHVVVSKEEDPELEPLRFRYVTSDKRERVVFDERTGSGTLRVGVLSHQRLRAALEYVELVELVRAATRLEDAFGYPLDIEFGFEEARLRILQVRPVPGATNVWQDTVNRFPFRAAGSLHDGELVPST